MEIRRPGGSDLDEDALAGALLGGLNRGLFLACGHDRKTLWTTRVREDLVAFLDIGQAVVKEGENVGSDLFTQTVTRAEILIDPNLHVRFNLTLRCSP